MKTSKICTKCNILKSLCDYPKRKISKDGTRNICKECYRKQCNSSYKKRDKKNLNIYRKKYSIKNKEKIQQYYVVYRNDNKEHIKELSSIYYYSNRESLLSQKKIYLNDNRDAINQKRSEKRLDNIDYYREKGREYYNKNRKHILRLSLPHSSKRRALKVTTEDGTITHESLSELVIKQKGKCYYCSVDLDFDTFRAVHLDHYIPLSKGGTHSIHNVVYSCSSCNLRKNAKDPIEFANKMGKLFWHSFVVVLKYKHPPTV